MDLDTLESVLAGIAPQLQLATAQGAATRVQFSSLDDFHPDRLFERVPVFGRLRTLRARLLQPATFEEAATELRAHGLVHGETAQAASAAAAADVESDSGTLQRLLGGRPAAPPEAAPARASLVDALIRRVIAPHVAPGSAPHLSVCTWQPWTRPLAGKRGSCSTHRHSASSKRSGVERSGSCPVWS